MNNMIWLIFFILVFMYVREVLIEFFIIKKLKKEQIAKYVRKVFVFRVAKTILLLIILFSPEIQEYAISFLALNEFIISKIYHKFLEEVKE